MDDDLLFFERQGRLMQYATLWQILFSGTPLKEECNDSRYADLKRNIALTLFVPPTSNILETKSLNTLEHSLKTLRPRNISIKTSVSFVRLGWHMCPEQVEFCRYFQNFVLFTARANEELFKWQVFVKFASALDNVTTVLREWAELLCDAITILMRTGSRN